MSLREFQGAVFGEAGLARGNKFVFRVFPPPAITATGFQLGQLLGGSNNNLNINLPVLDAIDDITAGLNAANIDLGGVNVGHNFNIPTLGYLIGNAAELGQHINLFCSSAQIPGVDVAATEGKQYGPSQMVGHNLTYADMAVEYYCAEDLRERRFFEQWQQSIFNKENGSVGYYEEYTSRAEIYVYNYGFTRLQAAYRFNELYPTNIEGQDFTHADGEPLKLRITFKYRDYDRIPVNTV